MCRECEVVLWRSHESCPSCRARRPGVRVRLVAPPAGARARQTVATVLTVPAALVAADHALRAVLA